MRRYFISLLLVVCAVGLTTGCGGTSTHSSKPQLVSTITGSGGQRQYRVRLPNGKIVIQAHSPSLAEPPKGLKLPRVATGVTTVEQYDSVDISKIPTIAHYVAGYVDGLWRNYPILKARFPVAVGISVRSADGADCLDMEPGNPPASEAGPWAKWQLTQGNDRPCEYSMISWMAAIKASLSQAGVPVCTTATQNHCVRLWDASWTYVSHLDYGYACTQWTDHSGGKNLDESTCAAWFYNRTIVPTKVMCYHKLELVKVCSVAKDQVAKDRSIMTAFSNGLKRDHCRKPYRRYTCRSQGFWFNYYWRDARKVMLAN